MSLHTRRDAIGLGIAMAGAAALAAWARPVARGDAARIDLGALFPDRFGSWRPDETLRAFVRTTDKNGQPYAFYDQVLERAYLGARGERVMLSVAFGNEQSTALQLHRPEVCYRASGYRVSAVHTAQLDVAARRLPVTRLHARRPGRSEPITYWTVVGGEPVADHRGALQRRIRFALKRELPDGLLVRVSSIGEETAPAWALHATFAAELAASAAPAQQLRMFGTATPA